MSKFSIFLLVFVLAFIVSVNANTFEMMKEMKENCKEEGYTKKVYDFFKEKCDNPEGEWKERCEKVKQRKIYFRGQEEEEEEFTEEKFNKMKNKVCKEMKEEERGEMRKNMKDMFELIKEQVGEPEGKCGDSIQKFKDAGCMCKE